MAYIERRRPDVGNVTWAHLRLPPFPQVALRVLQLANNGNVQLHQLSDLISSDPAFASEVLTIANSLLYAPRFPSKSIMQAIAVLGINNLQGMCLTVGARTYMGKALSLPFMQVIWRHSLACALIAEQLASAGFMDKDTAYTSGVLHDIGRLALATVRPKEYTALLETHSGSGGSILQAERDMFGSDHCGIVDPEKVLLRHIEVEYFGLVGLGRRAARSIPSSCRTEKCAKKLRGACGGSLQRRPGSR